jgi:uncharacterized protein (TIGR00730 family)
MAEERRLEDRQIFSSEDVQLKRHVRMIAEEFRRGFEAVARIDRPAVSIFGSARMTERHPAYSLAREVGRQFAREGWAVITGGGPGVMEAANRGCREAGGLSVGFNIRLPREQESNPYADLLLTFDHFYARKTMFVKAAEGFLIFPGGFGTLDELFESLTLIQTGKIFHFPVVLMDVEYWAQMLDWVRHAVLGEGMVSPEDVELLSSTDDPTEAVQTIVAHYHLQRAHDVASAGEADAQ